MDLGITNRVAMVAAASKGLGRAIAEALAKEGCKLSICSRSLESLEPVRSAIGGDTLAVACDVSNADDLQRWYEATVERFGQVDILVTNTGGPPAGPDPLAFSREQWEEAYRSLLLSPVGLIAHAVPGMRERGFGRIVSVGSSAVREPIPGLMLSNAHRSGLLASSDPDSFAKAMIAYAAWRTLICAKT